MCFVVFKYQTSFAVKYAFQCILKETIKNCIHNLLTLHNSSVKKNTVMSTRLLSRIDEMKNNLTLNRSDKCTNSGLSRKEGSL